MEKLGCSRWPHKPETAGPNPASASRKGPAIQLGDSEIEEIIAKDLTRGQIVLRFKVGEHAAQLARTQALAIRRERARVASAGASFDIEALRAEAEKCYEYLTAGSTAALDIDGLRARAEEYYEHLNATGEDGRLGTDRSKVTLFLTWLAASGTAP